MAAEPASGPALDAALATADVAAMADVALRAVDASSPAMRDAPEGGEPELAQREWSLCNELRARAGLSTPSAERVSWSTLVCETVDLDRFTHAAEPGYVSKLASSYDRSARSEGADGWFSNGDAGNYLRDEAGEHVMMEAFGPGAITRIWSANPSGRIRIYLDDTERPAFDLEMADFLAGRYEGALDALSFEAALGQNSYLPLPYATYARVTTTSSSRLYYQVDHRAYPEGTALEPFSPSGLRALAPLADVLRDYLADPSSALAALPSESMHFRAGETEQTRKLGPAVVRELRITNFAAIEQALRGTRVMIDVDGERAIDAPLGDLFGAGPGLQPHRSLPVEMRADALVLRWPMPVLGEVRVRFEGSAVSDMTVELRYTRGVPDHALRFHARWTGTQTFSTRDPEDWTVLHTKGSGWYVGTLLNVNNPTNLWWGEGDEKIFVDGEPFPSHFGTGTEDYFGMAWCSTELVATPWIGQTRADGPTNAGRVSNYRWHVGDAIPFTRELRFRLEVLHWLAGVFAVPFTEDAVAYWYASEEPDAPPLDSSDFRVVPVASTALPAIMSGASSCKL